MKTAISVPDETFNRASKRAAELGMSRSEFFTHAAQQYLEHLDASVITEQIDRTLGLVDDDDSSAVAAQAGRRFLSRDDEW
ncbi:antitoxin [Haloactinopolyspora alba]|uniref:antitoxin n=1 Tax=Haloactinopolyspora alba TaxID=648780 RepID=UPI000D0E1F8C|nr:antitoxin [Haloactinopolyspora alba]